jgi:two-component system, NarL family, response regulator NreC
MLREGTGHESALGMAGNGAFREESGMGEVLAADNVGSDPARARVTADTGSTTAMLVDDHAVVRAGIRLLLESQASLSVVAEASSVEEALQASLDRDPDLIVTDLSLEGLHGAAVVEAFAERFPDARIVVLSMVDDPSNIRKAIEAGAKGYLLKEAASAELAEAIARIMMGERYVQPALGAMLAGEGGASSGDANLVASLTEREREVLDLLVLGHTNVEIASLLFLSSRTVETHRASIQRKLGVKSRAGLVRFALGQGDQVAKFARPEGQRGVS